MDRCAKRLRAVGRDGFSLIEIIVVVALMSILLAMAVPPFLSWRNSLDYRQTARGVMALLKEARSLTISRNLQHMVVIEPGNSSYKLIPRTRAANTPSTGWTADPLQTLKSSPNVTIRSGIDGTSTDNVYIQFNPNGTVRLAAPDGTESVGNITVNDGATVKYRITVSTSGRIRLEKAF